MGDLLPKKQRGLRKKRRETPFWALRKLCLRDLNAGLGRRKEAHFFRPCGRKKSPAPHKKNQAGRQTGMKTRGIPPFSEPVGAVSKTTGEAGSN